MSCGCLWQTKCKDIPGKYWANLSASAHRRKISFNITIEEAADLLEKQEHRCALTGVIVGFGSPNTASLDRIHSDGEYRLQNVQWVHKDVNYMKMDLDNTTFIVWCNRVANKWQVELEN